MGNQSDKEELTPEPLPYPTADRRSGMCWVGPSEVVLRPT